MASCHTHSAWHCVYNCVCVGRLSTSVHISQQKSVATLPAHNDWSCSGVPAEQSEKKMLKENKKSTAAGDEEAHLSLWFNDKYAVCHLINKLGV